MFETCESTYWYHSHIHVISVCLSLNLRLPITGQSTCCSALYGQGGQFTEVSSRRSVLYCSNDAGNSGFLDQIFRVDAPS